MNELTAECPYELGNDLKFIKIIDHGAFGTVIHVQEISTNKDFAVKVINKIGATSSFIKEMKEEISILKQLNHENIVKFYGFKETNTQLLIKMEYIKYGTLKNWIKEQNKISENDASIILNKVLLAVEYLHNKQICHRDIKPENIMMSKKNDLKSIKIIDFGLSAQQFNYLEKNDYCGTFIYMAPEQIEKKLYYFSVDIWSIGILMYMLLNNGKHPFYHKGDKKIDVINKIKSGKIFFINKLSFMAKHLITKLCEPNPTNRYSASHAVKHPWITRNVNDEIPMTFSDILKKNNNKKNANYFIMISIFLNYYTKKEISNEVTMKNVKNKFYIINENYINNCDVISKKEKKNLLLKKQKCLEVLSTDEESFDKEENKENKEENKEENKKTNRLIKTALAKFIERNNKDVTPIKKIFAFNENSSNDIYDKKKSIKKINFKKKFKLSSMKNKISPPKEYEKIIKKRQSCIMPLSDLVNSIEENTINKTKTIQSSKIIKNSTLANNIININNKKENNNNNNNCDSNIEKSKSKSITKFNAKNFSREKSNFADSSKKNADVSKNKTNRFYLQTNLQFVNNYKNIKKFDTVKYRPIFDNIEKYNIVPLVLPFIGMKREEKRNKII